MFRRKAVATAVKVAFVSALAVSAAGCLVEGDQSLSTTGGTYARVTAPKGTITGLVQDTNGNPLSGVTVRAAGLSATTDEGGVYVFNNVPVTNTAGADGSTAHQSVSITILAPAGYLGATVTVKPEAQIDGSIGDEFRTNPVTTFVDGYLAQAGTAVLPALDATITGTLRDSVTDAPITGMDISLDLEQSDEGVDQEQTQNGVTTTYQTGGYSATTDDAGRFSFSGIPNDSELRFIVAGYSVESVQANACDDDCVNTRDELENVEVGNVIVSKINAKDDEDPFVKQVTGVMNQSAGVGMFNDDFDGRTIPIVFSEPMQAALVDDATGNSVVVRNESTQAYLTPESVSFDAATNTLTIVLAEADALEEGTEFAVLLLTADFRDAAGNLLDTEGTPPGVGYDDDVTSLSGAEYVLLDLKTFAESNTDAPAPTDLAQLERDDLGDDNNALVQARSTAFNDVDDDTDGFQQLNSPDNDDDFNGRDSAERLTQLATALSETAGFGPIDVNTNWARVSFTPTGASWYELRVYNASGNNVTDNFDGAPAAIKFAANAEEVGTGAGDDVRTFVDNGDVVEIVLNGETGFGLNGKMVEVTPIDDFGFAGTPAMITLRDNVEPTTIIQRAYTAGFNTSNDGDISLDFGEGGELSNIAGATVGTPYLNITPKLFDKLDGAGDSIYDTDTVADDTLDKELYALNVVDDATGDPWINGAYDATAFAAWSDLGREIGIAFSEDIALTGDPAYDGTGTLLSGWTAHNDVFVRDDGSVTNADLVDVQVSNVFALAADDGSIIDFSGVLEDRFGNGASADANARVIVRDATPPFVQEAIWNGRTLDVTFNEDVNVSTDTAVTLANDAGTVCLPVYLSQDTVDGHDGSNVLSIPRADWEAALGGKLGDVSSIDEVFDLPDYDEGLIDDQGNNAFQHTYLVPFGVSFSFTGCDNVDEGSGVMDANGNDWTTDPTGLEPPVFAAFENAGDWDVTGSSTNFTGAAAGDTITFSFVFTHQLDMLDSFGVAQDATTLDQATTAAAFEFVDNGSCPGVVIDAGAGAATGAVLSSSAKTLTVTVELAAGGPIGASDCVFRFVNDAISRYDVSLNLVPAATEIQAP